MIINPFTHWQTYKKLSKFTIKLMGKSRISMAMFNGYVKLPEGTQNHDDDDDDDISS